MSEIPRGPGYRGTIGGNTMQFRFAILASALVAGLVLSATASQSGHHSHHLEPKPASWTWYAS